MKKHPSPVITPSFSHKTKQGEEEFKAGKGAKIVTPSLLITS